MFSGIFVDRVLFEGDDIGDDKEAVGEEDSMELRFRFLLLI